MRAQSQADHQAAFAAALLDARRALPPGLAARDSARTAERFAVYRNNVMVGLVDALQATFPVTAQLVGEEFFRAMARVHVTQQLPASAALAKYGDGLPAFIERFAPAAGLPYLADVVRLELAWTRAYCAAEAAPLAPAQLAALSPERLLRSRFVPHPATQLLRSQHPVAALWQAHQQERSAEPSVHWVAECALVTRPAAEVRVQVITPGEYEFLLALQTGMDVENACLAAIEVQGSFTPGNALSIALVSGACSGCA